MKLSRILSTFVLTLSLSGYAHAAVDKDGLTPLHRAAGRGDLAQVKALLKTRTQLTTLDTKMGVSVLHKAVYSGNAEVVGYLLDRGALIDLSSPSNGNTPLHDAIYFKPGQDTRVIQAILAHGPSLAIRNRAGLTSIESARLLKDEETVKLIEVYRDSISTARGRDLMKAVRANDVAVVRTLLSSGRLSVDEADEQGFTPLIWAAREGFVEITRDLLDRGANPNALDQWMRANAGHKAAFWGRAETLGLLIEHGLDVNAQGGYNGYTALHDAVARNHFEAARALVEAGSRTDIAGHDGKTARDLARTSCNPKLIELVGAR